MPFFFSSDTKNEVRKILSDQGNKTTYATTTMPQNMSNFHCSSMLSCHCQMTDYFNLSKEDSQTLVDGG